MPQTDKTDAFAPAFQQIEALLQAGKPLLVSIDGNCGSGKTLLAARIAQRWPCNVFHMDDYYLPLPQRAQNWQQQPAGNMDLQRFLAEVLQPTKAGQPVCSAAFSCANKAYGAPQHYTPQRLTVVEGTTSQHPLFCGYYGLNIFLHCTPQVQRARLIRREGAHFADFERLWIPMEERYFAACRKTQGAVLEINTDTEKEEKS